jgi:hypothetical protein
MKPADRFKEKHEICCSACGQATPSYDIVNYGSLKLGYKQLCLRCFNMEAATLGGLDKFEHAKFTPVGLADCTGATHEFHFRTRLFGAGVALEGFELHDGHPAGYQFQIIGEPEDDLLVLFGQLIEKMRRALSIKHLTDGTHGQHIADRLVQGMIEFDGAADGRVPTLIIDGREITWEDFGHMLMSFEGWQFQLNIRDKSEEF